VVVQANQGNITEGPLGAIIADSLTTTSSGSTSLMGANHVSSFTASSFGDVSLTNASALLTPVVEAHGGSFTLKQSGDVNLTRSASFDALNINASGTLTVLAGATATDISSRRPMKVSVGKDLRILGGSGSGTFASLTGYSDMNLTIGGQLHVNAGTGADAFARVWTVNRDSVINIYFPNLSSGGYFVNDIDGALRRGHSGILSGQGVATPGHLLFVTYGE